MELCVRVAVADEEDRVEKPQMTAQGEMSRGAPSDAANRNRIGENKDRVAACNWRDRWSS